MAKPLAKLGHTLQRLDERVPGPFVQRLGAMVDVEHVEAKLGHAVGGKGLLQCSEHRSSIPLTPSGRLHQDLVEEHAVGWHPSSRSTSESSTRVTRIILATLPARLAHRKLGATERRPRSEARHEISVHGRYLVT